MPSRHFAAAIVIFWLGTTGWMLYRDLWPRLSARGGLTPTSGGGWRAACFHREHGVPEDTCARAPIS